MKTKRLFFCLLSLLFLLLLHTPVYAGSKPISITYQQTKKLDFKPDCTTRPDIIRIKDNKITGLKPGKTYIYVKNKKIPIQVKRKVITKKKPIYIINKQTKTLSANLKVKQSKHSKKYIKIQDHTLTGIKSGKTYIYFLNNYTKIKQPVIIESPYFKKHEFHQVYGDTFNLKRKDCHEKVKYLYDSWYFDKTKKGFYVYEDYGVAKIKAKVNNKILDSATIHIGNLIPERTECRIGHTKELYPKQTRQIIDFKLESNDPKIVSISKTGLLTPRSIGITTIKATLNNKQYFGTVIVTNKQQTYDLRVDKISDYKSYISPMLYQALSKFKIDYQIARVLPAYPNDPDVAGYIDITAHQIYIRSDQNYSEITFHELGHFFNHLKGYISGSKEFYEIYKTEAFKNKSYYRDYARTSPNEYFAEAFVPYIFEPNIMKVKSPLTYNFIDKAYKSISNTEIQDLINKYPYPGTEQEQRAGSGNINNKPNYMPIESDPLLSLR